LLFVAAKRLSAILNVAVMGIATSGIYHFEEGKC